MFKRIYSIMFFACVLAACSFGAFVYAESLQFDSAMEMQGMPAVKSTISIKDKKMHFEMNMQGQQFTYYFDGQKAFMYMPQAGYALAIPISEMLDQMPVNQNYKDIPGLQRIGSEQLNGKDCDVYEYMQKNVKSKIWVEKDIDFPVKSETITDKGKVTSYMSNIKRHLDLDDSLFILPAGIKVMDMAEQLKSLGNKAQEKDDY